jgi:hypothetical protein
MDSDAEDSTGSLSSDSINDKSQAFDLAQWHPLSYEFDKPFTLVISASRNSGKSYLVKHLYQNYLSMHFDSVVVFSHSVCNGFYEEFLPGKLFFNDYSESVLSKVVCTASAMKQKNKNYRVLVILDDCLNRKNAYSPSLNKLFSMGRHINISCIMVSQTLKTYFSGLMRENTNLLIILHQRSRGEKLYLYEKFLDDRIDDDDLPRRWRANKKDYVMKLLKVTCRDYQGVVVEMENQSLDYKKCIFKYRA